MSWTGPSSNSKNRRNAGIKARSLINPPASGKLSMKLSMKLYV
jgi:hypothetical protein